MNTKKGCSMIVFLMLLVAGVFTFEFLKLNQSPPSGGCSSDTCAFGGPKNGNGNGNEEVPVNAVPQQAPPQPEIMGHDSTGGSWAAPF